VRFLFLGRHQDRKSWHWRREILYEEWWYFNVLRESDDEAGRSMDQAEIMDVAYDAVWTLLKVTTPLMLIALGVGLIIALFQALTQIQEMTLTFVPKILVIFIALLVLLPWMITELTEFMGRMVDHFIGLPN
jgi:flagellar biosynthetic protein FliQ